jgi:hypothetical protein
MYFWVISACFWRILANIGGSGARFEAIYWEEVGRLIPNPNIYKPRVLRSIKEVQNKRNDENLKAKAIFM